MTKINRHVLMPNIVCSILLENILFIRFLISFKIFLKISSFNLSGNVSIMVAINSNPKHFPLTVGTFIHSGFSPSDKSTKFLIKLAIIPLSQ